MSTIQNQSAGGIWVNLAEAGKLDDGSYFLQSAEDAEIKYVLNVRYDKMRNMEPHELKDWFVLMPAQPSPAEQQISQLRSLLPEIIYKELRRDLLKIESDLRNGNLNAAIRSFPAILQKIENWRSPHQTNKEGEAK